MDFFELQDRARAQTRRLIALFALGVAVIVASTTLAVWGVLMLANPATDAALSAGDAGLHRPFDAAEVANDPALLALVALGTLLLIGGGSLFRIMQLGGGGAPIAERLGGKPLDHDTADPDERRVLNVVEEMAIASGMPVPPVYMLENERAINAFAAGTTPENAAIGVTRGTVRLLSRDELQGVMGHEFSHILSGDMKINIRLIGVLAGILVLGHLGSLMMRSAWYAGAVGGSRRSRDKGGGVIAIYLLGAVLALLGFVGVFFGSWIKSAVSRQREYLADASAVQFTRSRDGIAGALKKIGGFPRHAMLKTPGADECSHMFFGKGVSSVFATHPPLAKRILALDPSWDGSYPRVEEPPRGHTTPEPEKTPPKIAADRFAHAVTVSAAAMIGQPSNDHLAYAATLYVSIPEPLRAMAGTPFSARAVIAAMLISRDKPVQRAQLDLVRRHGGEPLLRELRAAAPMVGRLDPGLRLPLIELTAPSLQRLAGEQAEDFRTLVRELIDADGTTDLFEWCLRRLVGKPLDSARRSVTHIYNIKGAEQECEKLLGWLAVAGHTSMQDAHHAYALGIAKLGITPGLAPRSGFEAEEIDEVVTTLSRTAPRIKKDIVEACAVVISADKTITPQEAELFRVITIALGVPVPPVLPGQPLI